MSKYIKANDIKSKLRGRWLNVYLSLAPQLNNAVNKFGTHVTCPVHGGIHGDAFRLDNKNSDGAAYCNTCGKFLDGIEVLRWVNNWTFRETIERLDDYINGLHINDLSSGYYNNQTKSINSYSCEPNNSDIEKRRKSVERIIKTSSKTPLDAHLSYFEKRGIYPIAAPSLRYHAGLPYYYNGKPIINSIGEWVYYPCIVGIYKNASGISGISRIYLDKDGNKAGEQLKLDLSRMGLSEDNPPVKVAYKIESLSGSAVRLGSIGETVAICEGIETGIALKNSGLTSVLACTTATLMQAIYIPSFVKNIVIYADGDDAGINAASELTGRLSDRLTITKIPPVELAKIMLKPDWLDAINHGFEI